MSMICYLRRLSAKDLERLKVDSTLTEGFFGENDIEGFDPFADLDVDKAWHGIHYLLTGSASEGAPPLNFLVLGGEALGEDMGYGPPRGFSPSGVKAIAAALSAVTSDTLSARYDPSAMQRQEVYPGFWVREGEEGLTYVINYFDELKQFVIEAAESGEALVVFLS